MKQWEGPIVSGIWHGMAIIYIRFNRLIKNNTSHQKAQHKN